MRKPSSTELSGTQGKSWMINGRLDWIASALGLTPNRGSSTGDSLDATPRAATPQRSCGTRGKSGVTPPPSVGIFLRAEPTAGNWGVTRSGFSGTLRSAGLSAPPDASSPTFRRPNWRFWGAGEAGGRAGLAQAYTQTSQGRP